MVRSTFRRQLCCIAFDLKNFDTVVQAQRLVSQQYFHGLTKRQKSEEQPRG